jgi:hypothetical protein
MRRLAFKAILSQWQGREKTEVATPLIWPPRELKKQTPEQSETITKTSIGCQRPGPTLNLLSQDVKIIPAYGSAIKNAAPNESLAADAFASFHRPSKATWQACKVRNALPMLIAPSLPDPAAASHRSLGSRPSCRRSFCRWRFAERW